MLFFAFSIIFFLATGAILYLMVRALPRVAEEAAAADGNKKNWLDRWAHSELPEKIDNAVNGFLFKFLRKTKVTVLKLDNTLSNKLQKMKPEEGNGKPAIDFKEIASKTEESKA
ncbi:MAG: hypothetical protein KGJ13_07470 [Patescibacteria group bacterium]|nr:hypothetical protein [Patescibacteria group bacterium]